MSIVVTAVEIGGITIKVFSKSNFPLTRLSCNWCKTFVARLVRVQKKNIGEKCTFDAACNFAVSRK